MDGSKRSVSQTCSSRYPNQRSDYVVLPLVFRIGFSHTAEQHCGFGSALSP